MNTDLPAENEPGPLESAPFAPPPVDPQGEYPVLPPEAEEPPTRFNVGEPGQAYEPYSNQRPPPDPTERQYSLLQILGMMTAAAVTLGVVRRFVDWTGPGVVSAVTGLVLIVALGVQAVFQPSWALFKLTVWLLMGAYVASIGLALCWR